MLTIVYAPAYNNIQLPVTAFQKYEDAKEFLISVFGNVETVEEEKKGKRKFLIGNNSRKNERGEVIVDEITQEQAKKLFKSYYGGCGECYTIVAKEIDDGQVPLFHFDLD